MMEHELSNLNDEMMEPKQRDEYVVSSPAWQKCFTQYARLHKALLKGDLEDAVRSIDDDSSSVTAPITPGGETALHIAAMEGHLPFVVNLLGRMSIADLERPNDNGSNALCFAAVAGHLDIAKLMIIKNPKLPSLPGITPLYLAALQGHKDMAEHLFSLSGFKSWSTDDQVELLFTCIDSGLYDLAKSIVGENEQLVLSNDSNGETPLEVLASKPSAFCRGNQKGWWGRIANTILCVMRLKKGSEKAAQCDARELFELLREKMISPQDIETGQVNGNIVKSLFRAAEFGNDDFVVELIRQYPHFLYEVNHSQHSIFHIAVSHRYVRLFNLIYELGRVKDLITTYIDDENNNILHLAAKLAPQSQLNCIPGPALQMQREVLWYKEIEKIVHPTFRKRKNSVDKTPYELFLSEHENLMTEGEKVMKQTAKACMLVTMLIATVVFTTAFTVPGGYNNNTGAPILQNEKLFMIFPISEAVATLSSLTSMLMFLSILTSRYTEMDFLTSLPFWLVVGVMALFVSIVAMMVTFCSCLLFYQHGLMPVISLLIFFAFIPIMFIILKYPLLVTILRCSYSGRWLFRSNNRLFI